MGHFGLRRWHELGHHGGCLNLNGASAPFFLCLSSISVTLFTAPKLLLWSKKQNLMNKTDGRATILIRRLNHQMKRLRSINWKWHVALGDHEESLNL